MATNPKNGRSGKHKTNNVERLLDELTGDKNEMYAWNRMELRIGS